MAEFTELVKNFDKIRDYMRDFYIYGFKRRADYTYKSVRTYDNERRRIECWLKDYVQWDYSEKGKRVFVAIDSVELAENPLYRAYKSKSFTDNDAMLHFYLLDVLSARSDLNAEQAADAIAREFGAAFDLQTVRGKLKEYAALGIFSVRKSGRSHLYRLAGDFFASMPGAREKLIDACSFFREAAPFGVVGSYIADLIGGGDLFRFKHRCLAHTLEDRVLFVILRAMHEKRGAELDVRGQKSGRSYSARVTPLKVLTSTQTGRRYAAAYRGDKRRFFSLRLDSIKRARLAETDPAYDTLMEKFEKNYPLCWGVTWGGRSRMESVCFRLRIDEKREGYVLDRPYREGRGGQVRRAGENEFCYRRQMFDAQEILPWIKSFTGRIIAAESSNPAVRRALDQDFNRMAEMYGEGENC